MGFCRRCGDIVVGARCKCGGTAVAPVIPWSQADSKEDIPDRWSKTYVSKDRSPTRPISRGPPSIITHTTGSTAITSNSSSAKRFPRPLSSNIMPSQPLGSRVTAHITSSTSQLNRPPSPLKYSTTLPAPEDDILPSLSPNDNTLSKVYGSILQPKESLTTHSCTICSTPFPPDATIYPDPSASTITNTRFLCRPCFTTNGGSKGTCPTCTRPVLTLKSEGGFIHAADKYWHKRCFNCEGCFKNIGDKPLVDLLGRPSCPECFDSCLTRDQNTPTKSRASNSIKAEKSNNLGGMGTNVKEAKSREGSPAIEELEQRLGISKNREGSPALEELTQRLSMIGKEIETRYSPSGGSPITSPRASKYSGASRDNSPLINRSRGRRDSRMDESPSPIRRYDRFKSPELESGTMSGDQSPARRNTTHSPAPTEEAIEEMKQRFMKGSSYSPVSQNLDSTHSPSLPVTRPLRISRSSTSLNVHASKISVPESNEPMSPLSPTVPATPDLMSDFSDTTTQSSSSSGPDSPPRHDNDGESDVFTTSKVYGRGYGTRYTRGDFLDNNGGDLVNSGTPTRTTMPMKSSNSSMAYSLPVPIETPSPPVKTKSKHPLLDSRGSTEVSASAICAKCGGALFAIRGKGKFVTVPNDGDDGEPKSYHTECFRCAICEGIFKEGNKGQALFVKANGVPCHVECAPTTIKIRKSRSSSSLAPAYSSASSPSSTSYIPASSSTTKSSTSKPALSSRYDRPPPTTPSATSIPTMVPRFGSRAACPGCNKSVSPMERGVVPGPQGTRWHATCLVCGGKKETAKGWISGWGREDKKGEPGCGKKLDSAAKSDREGGVWCRECLLLLGVGGSPQVSPTRTPLVPSYTGTSGKLVTQLTGTTTLARQFTGLGGGSDAALLRQLTGGGSSPTRSRSPTKQLGAIGGGGIRPRPKSVIGMRNTKSIDEGRGMFLVRQLTGATSGGWED